MRTRATKRNLLPSLLSFLANVFGQNSTFQLRATLKGHHRPRIYHRCCAFDILFATANNIRPTLYLRLNSLSRNDFVKNVSRRIHHGGFNDWFMLDFVKNGIIERNSSRRFHRKILSSEETKCALSLSLSLRAGSACTRLFTAVYTCVIRRPRNKYIEFTHVLARLDPYRYDLADDSPRPRQQLRRLSYATLPPERFLSRCFSPLN